MNKALLVIQMRQTLVSLLLFLVLCVDSFEGLGDIHDEKYFCISQDDISKTGQFATDASKLPSQRRILLISPQKNFLSNRYLIHSYSLLFIHFSTF